MQINLSQTAGKKNGMGAGAISGSQQRLGLAVSFCARRIGCPSGLVVLSKNLDMIFILLNMILISIFTFLT
jgi:hypothetical protein